MSSVKKIAILLFLWNTVFGISQEALHNFGNLKIHNTGAVGFHHDLINDGFTDDNKGLVGFFSNENIIISGAFKPIFENMEIMAANNLFLEVNVGVTTNTNFVLGNIITPRNFIDINLEYSQNAFYTGVNNISKVDGYVAINNQQNFTFPVGDSQQLRPLIIESTVTNTLAKCAYFFENPNTSSTFTTNFDTARKSLEIGSVSTIEFWRLEGTQASTIQISWNERSTIETLTDDPSMVILVGWSKSRSQWVSLAAAASIGDLTQGIVRSVSFVPDDYEIITFGTLGVDNIGEDPMIDLDDFLVSANGDGINESFIIPELEQSPNNTLRIYDRYGLKVFEMDNYTDQFNGFANTRNIVSDREKGLPTGIYFYIVSMSDLGLDLQGFLYLTR